MSANTSTGQRERNTINIDSLTKVIVNQSRIAEIIPDNIDTDLPAQNAKMQRARDILAKTAVGSAKAQQHQNSSTSMKANNCAVVTNSRAPRSLPTNQSTVTPLTTTQVKIIIAVVIAHIIRQAVNAEGSVYAAYDLEYTEM